MKCTDSHLVNNHWKPGDVVWATSVRPSAQRGAKDNLALVKPQRGILAAGDAQVKHERFVAASEFARCTHFVPFAKSGSKLSWSKAVTIYARDFASTEREATEIYNEKLRIEIERREIAARELRAELIPADNRNGGDET